jgi:hypothetical protein
MLKALDSWKSKRVGLTAAAWTILIGYKYIYKYLPNRIFAGATEFVHLGNSSSVQAGRETGVLIGLPVCNNGDPSAKLNIIINWKSESGISFYSMG